MYCFIFSENISWIPEPNSGGIDDLEKLNDNEDRVDPQESDAESEHSEHLTDSEQSEEEQLDEFENDPENCLLGKDKITLWHLCAPRQNVRRRRHNLVIHLPGVKKVAKQAKTPLDCWSLFFPNSMIGSIVEHTNRYLDKARENYSRARDVRATSVIEIKALFGLLYMAGLMKAQHLNVKQLWATDGTGVECFRATMSKERFLLLLRMLRFDNFQNREERKALDNLAAIREVLDEFTSHCKENYTVGEYCTIDEMLESFHGRCKFRQYIPSKPAKYGLKVYSLADARTFYTSNIEVYCGRQPDGPYKVENGPSYVVKRLSEHILGTGRNITMDNYFTSLPLAKELLDHKTTIVGTLRKNKKEVPPSFLVTKGRPLNNTMFAYTKTETLVSYKIKSNKVVLALSTMHNDGRIDESSGVVAKPEIITFYNFTKGGVDVVDGMKALYSVARISCRWPLTLFFTLLNVGGINSQIIYNGNTEKVIERRDYLKTLALSLINEHLVIRSSIETLPFQLKESTKRIAGINDETALEEKRPEGLCAYCPRRKNRKTVKKCGKCKKSICTSHTKFMCVKCNEEQNV